MIGEKTRFNFWLYIITVGILITAMHFSVLYFIAETIYQEIVLVISLFFNLIWFSILSTEIYHNIKFIG